MRITGKKESETGICNRWGLCFTTLLIVLVFLTSAAQAGEITRKWKINNWINKMQVLPIPDAPGRVIGFYERLGKAVYEDGETAEQVLRCTFDMLQGAGSFQGYGQLRFEDGSTTLMKIEGVMNPPKKGALPTGQGTGKYVGGTGRFQGIQGNMSFKVTVLKPIGGENKGDALVELESTYTLPAK